MGLSLEKSTDDEHVDLIDTVSDAVVEVVRHIVKLSSLSLRVQFKAIQQVAAEAKL